MIQRRFANIISYLRLRITNAASESINSKIQWVNTPHVVSAAKRTSSPPSTSTAAASVSRLQPTKNPESPDFARDKPS
jgi:hypothetical protein